MDPAYVNGFLDGNDLVLLYRNVNGEMLARRRRAEWSSFYKRSTFPKEVMRELRKHEAVGGISEEGEWIRINWTDHFYRKRLHEPGNYFDQAGIEHFEADVYPIRRFFADTGARIAKPRRIYLDIETDSRVTPALARQGKARVLCWTLVDDDVQVVGQGMLERETDEDEARILEQLWRTLDPYDQMISWFGDGFDFPIVKKRTDIVGAPHKDFRRWLEMDFMPIYERMNRNAAESGEEKESLKLQDVCMARLGEGKNAFDSSKTYEAWAAGGESRQKLAEYCAQDTKLLPKLNKKTGFLDINDAICQIGSLFADTRSADPTNFVDGFLLRMGVERGTHFPTKQHFSKEKQERHKKFAGAFVMKPKSKGIERNLHVCDFSGMYPSIILTWNMSPETKREIAPEGPIPNGCCRAPSTHIGFSTKSSGILPDALKEIRRLRKEWSKKQAELPPGTDGWWEAARKSTAYKVIANSFYGVIGSPWSRFFDQEIAESVTQNGVWLIQKTIAAAEERGWTVLYGDTDSCVVKGPSRYAFDEFANWCNATLYPELLKNCACVDNYIEIAYEKEFARLVQCGAKRYVGVYAQYKWSAACACTTANGEPGSIDVRQMTCRDCGQIWQELPPPRGKPEIRGLEYKRGDAGVLARKLQWDVIQKLMRDLSEDPDDFKPILKQYQDHILYDILPLNEIRFSNTLDKPLKDYAAKLKKDGTNAAQPAHVQVAKLLESQGQQIEEGHRIEYFIVDASVTPRKVAPASEYKGESDRHWLWEDKVAPPTLRLLTAAFPHVDWSAWERTRPGRKYTSLEDAGQQTMWDRPRINVEGQALVRLERKRNPGSCGKE